MSDDVVFMSDNEGDYYLFGHIEPILFDEPEPRYLEVPRDVAEAFLRLREFIQRCPRVELYDHPRRPIPQVDALAATKVNELFLSYEEVFKKALRE